MNKIRKMTIAGATFASICALSIGAANAQGTTLELMHFWTSGGEANAMQVIKDEAEKAGIVWEDAAVAGGAGMNAYQVLQARIAGLFAGLS